MPRSQPFDDQWPTGDPVLAGFADDLRTIAGGPAPEPRAGLRALMGQGPGRPVPIDSSPGRRKMLVKTLVGGLAAKVAFGMGVAAASVTAAGAAGVLPDTAQQAVASVVSAATPFALPDPSDVTVQVGGDTDSSTSKKTPSTPTSTPTTGDDEGGTRTLNHGACVSAVAKVKTDEGSHGKTVSSVARSDCGKKADPVVSSTTSTTVAGSSTTSTTIAASNQRSADSGPGNSGNNGNGGNGNNGNGGNSGQGNSGKR